MDSFHPSVCESEDQRGAPRPLDGDDDLTAVCDIGAVEALPCLTTQEITLDNVSFTTTSVWEACMTITTGPAFDVWPPGDVTLRVRERVTLGNGTSIHTGGQLRVVIDPAAGSGLVLP